MPPLLAGIAHAGRRGVLVKSALVMEQLGGVTAVVFDKTGTLTPLPLGVAGHEGCTVLVDLNGLRLLRRSAWRGGEIG